MSHPDVDEQSSEFVVDEHGDGGRASQGGGPALAFVPGLSPEQFAVIMVNRVYIERAKGLLMAIYGIDAERAFDLLRWRSQVENVKLRCIARQLTEEFPTLSAAQRLPAGYDEILLTVRQRIAAEPT